MNNNLNNVESLGFKKLSYQEKAQISGAGVSFGAIIKGTSSFLNSGVLGGVTGLINNILGSTQKNKIMNLLENSKKVEIEFGKDGQIEKAKWDAMDSSPRSTIIF